MLCLHFLGVFHQFFQALEHAKMSAMKDLGVDLTSLLVAKEKAPDKLYKFEGGGLGLADNKAAGGNNARKVVKLHVHETNS